MTEESGISRLIDERRDELLEQWLECLEASGAARPDLLAADRLREECGRFLSLLAPALADGKLQGSGWEDLRAMLAELSRSRALLGFTPTETATFIFSFKEPLFDMIQSSDLPHAADEIWQATKVLDRIGLFTIETYQINREEVIRRQQDEMLELSTPVVRLWEGVLLLPLIGTLDSARTQVVMESLLQMIDDTGSTIAIIDITGVPTVDTLVAQHLLKTASAARLMGAEVILSGIRPQIAQTVVQLGVEMPEVTTKASISSAFSLALARSGWSAVRNNVG